MKFDDPYKEAIRYIDNAKDILKLSEIDGRHYIDEKYVKIACGTAYSGILVALDGLFEIKKIPKKRGRKTIEYYKSQLSKIDKKLLKDLDNAYTVLHLDGYYGGISNVKTVESGFDDAISIISALKPYSTNGISNKGK